MIAWQGGDAAVVDDTGRLPQARLSHQVDGHARRLRARRSMRCSSGATAVALGAGRDKKGDAVDLSAGILLRKKPGEAVAAGEPVLELRYNDASRLDAALALATQAVVIGDHAEPEPAARDGVGARRRRTMFVGEGCDVDIV